MRRDADEHALHIFRHAITAAVQQRARTRRVEQREAGARRQSDAHIRVRAARGHQRLDDAAVLWVKAHWRYEPAMQGPKPIPSTATAEVTFKLK